MSSPLAEAVASRLQGWATEEVADRLWARDGSLWAASGHDPAEVAAWLGWLDLPDQMRSRVGELTHTAEAIQRDGYRRAAVLGMGGSSLAPEVYGRLLDGSVDLRICDSTHPDAVRGFRSWATAARTVLFVSSKSGTTTESLAFHAALAEQVPALDFVAITDPGSPLADLARTQEFRGIIEGEPSVGGRFSALSVFGLLPAAVRGVEIASVLGEAAAMADACRRPAPDNPGLQLGALLGEAAMAGRDKLTILTSPRLATLGSWIEQLVAESTGKVGRGIVPVVGEEPAPVDAYGPDRCFVVYALAGDLDIGLSSLAGDLRAAGHPVTELSLARPEAVGAEFFRWEMATAAAGIVLGVDPFDQPDVAAAKAATAALLDELGRTGAFRSPMPLAAEPGLAAYARPGTLGPTVPSLEAAVRSLLAQVEAGDYVALLAYLPPDRDLVAVLQRVRATIRDRLGVATSVGLGPHYLHSTGQLHKGGPNTGVFVVLTTDPGRDLPIPGRTETFGDLHAAQAVGDLAALQARGRRVLRLHADDAANGLSRTERLVAEALASPVG